MQKLAILDIYNPDNVESKLGKTYPEKEIIFIQTDVSQKEQVQNAFRIASEKFHFIDIVISNAGFMNEREYERTINVNLICTAGISATIINSGIYL